MSVNNVLESVREDDFVEYYLFPLVETKDDNEQEVLLSSTLKKANETIRNLTKDYLWHKDAFKLTARTSISNRLSHIEGKTEDLPPHLYGVSHFGDNIEDEWFMVYILQCITRELPGLIAKVYDADGEFLLIEAAEYLPKWLNYDTSKNRVYMYEGAVHIIQPEDLESIETNSVSNAISTLRTNPPIHLASTEIQTAISRKLASYPDKIKDNLHRATIYVPIGVANILKTKPHLIAPAVQAFCNRDSVDVKACKAMKYFPPENRVNTSVVFTKCLYAMLTHSKYQPDKRTGWNLPQINSPQYKAHLLGVRVACGFEILVSQAKPSADVEQDKGWHNYVNSLKNKGYFNGLMECSKPYNDLLNKAKEYYVNHRDTMHFTPAIGQEILDLLRNLELTHSEAPLPPDDDDSWLDITPEALDKLLQEKYGQKKFVTVNNNTNPEELTEKLTTFLHQVSDVDGVEFPTRPPRKNKNKVSFEQPTGINFDPNSFSCAVQNILNFVIPEDDSWDLESGSDMSEYEDDNYVNVENYEETKGKMQQYMEEMDRELAGTTIGSSFEKKPKNGEDGFEDIESFEPVDIDVNALKNLLESYKAQMGQAGPSSNLLESMGVHLDAEKDNNAK